MSPTWIQIGIVVLNLLVLGLILPLTRAMSRLRSNEIAHLVESIADIRNVAVVGISEIRQDIQKHLQWHLDHP